MLSNKLLLSLVSLVSISLPAFAQSSDAPGASDSTEKSFAKRGHHRHGGKGFSPLSSLTGQLALSADQKAKVEAIKTESHSQIQPLRDQLKSSKQQLRSLMSAKDLDRPALESLFDQIQTQEASVKKIRFNSMLSVASVLTSEQRAELKSQMSARIKARKGLNPTKG